MKDGAETYAVLTYGRIVALSRQAIINDDLRGFDRLVSAFGNSSRRLENRTVYAQLTANAPLSDTVALFHANHANLQTGAGSALQMSALTAARAAMRVQKGYQNEELNVVPNFLICPAALEQAAYQLTSSQYVPAKSSDVNEFRFGGRTALTPIIEPILDASSATAWYMASDSNQIDTVEYCYLDGAEGPVIETDAGFDVDGISYKCRLDFAAKAVDYRGLYKANGA
jgi:phage major head subunit gpT-like protein